MCPSVGTRLRRATTFQFRPPYPREERFRYRLDGRLDGNEKKIFEAVRN
jgi:hypothetical protein